MRTTIDTDDELERLARARAGADRKSLSDIVNEALESYLPSKMIIEFGKTTINSGPTISRMKPDVVGK